jgi:hypothetical protein
MAGGSGVKGARRGMALIMAGELSLETSHFFRFEKWLSYG